MNNLTLTIAFGEIEIEFVAYEDMEMSEIEAGIANENKGIIPDKSQWTVYTDYNPEDPITFEQVEILLAHPPKPIEAALDQSSDWQTVCSKLSHGYEEIAGDDAKTKRSYVERVFSMVHGDEIPYYIATSLDWGLAFDTLVEGMELGKSKDGTIFRF